MRILFCVNSLGTRGGIERVTIVKANALAEMTDGRGATVNSVAIAYSDRFRFPETIHPLSPLVKTYDTEADIWHNWNDHGLKKITEPIRKMWKYFRRLQGVVNSFRPDVIVGVGQSEKFLIPFLKSDNPILRIREVHFNSTYRWNTYGSGWRSVIKIKVADFIDYKINCRLYDRVFLLTKEDKDENFANNDRFSWMWNPCSFTTQDCDFANLRDHVVCAVGRLNDQKDFPSLLRSWSLLRDRIGDWKLKIIGEGPREANLKQMAEDLGIADSVVFAGHSQNVAQEMCQASVFAFTSLFEGFGLVLVEALSCGLPIVSFDTKYGPRDIIRDGVDGFLVENRDEKIMAERLYQLMCDEKLREKMAENAELRAKDFDVNIIAEKWMKEYEILLEKKRK